MDSQAELGEPLFNYKKQYFFQEIMPPGFHTIRSESAASN